MFQEKIVTLDEKARNLIKVCALSSVGWSKVYVRGVARDERQKVARERYKSIFHVVLIIWSFLFVSELEE